MFIKMQTNDYQDDEFIYIHADFGSTIATEIEIIDANGDVHNCWLEIMEYDGTTDKYRCKYKKYTD